MGDLFLNKEEILIRWRNRYYGGCSTKILWEFCCLVPEGTVLQSFFLFFFFTSDLYDSPSDNTVPWAGAFGTPCSDAVTMTSVFVGAQEVTLWIKEHCTEVLLKPESFYKSSKTDDFGKDLLKRWKVTSVTQADSSQDLSENWKRMFLKQKLW